MDFTFAQPLHYLIHHSDGEYVAHCLDMDLVGTAKNEKDAIEQLNDAVRVLVLLSFQSQRSVYQHAPKRYWDMFEEAKTKNGTKTRTLVISAEISPVTVKQCHFTYCLAVAA
jgi:hypothetical protein